MQWEKVEVKESGSIEEVTRPLGALCLVPFRKKMGLRGNMEILLEEVNSKSLSSPYSLISFAQFSKLVKKSSNGEITLEGKEYKVYVPCPSNKLKLQEGDHFYVKKSKEYKTFQVQQNKEEKFNTLTIQAILSHLDCLDLVSAAYVSKLWWNSAVSSQHGRTMLEVSPAVQAYAEIVSKSKTTHAHLTNYYINKAEENFIRVLQKQEKKIAEIFPAETHVKKSEKEEEDEDEDAENEEEEDNWGNGEDGEEEEEGEDGEEEEEEENDPDEWNPAVDIKLPTDLKECYKLSDGLSLHNNDPFTLYLSSLDDACDTERGEYGMYGCERFLSGRSSYIAFGGEGEYSEFAINIDQHDPCYGYTYVFVNNLPMMAYSTYSFSQFVIEIARMLRTPGGASRLKGGSGSETDMQHVIEANERKRKWKSN